MIGVVRGALAVALLAGFCASCDGDGPAAPRTLALHRTGQGADGIARVSLAPLDEPGAWEPDAPGVSVPPADTQGDARVLVVGAGRADQAISLSRRGRLSVRGAAALRLFARFEGRGQVTVELLDGAGAVLSRAGPVALIESDAVRAYELPLDDAARALDAVEVLRLRCDGGARRLGVASIEVVPAFDLSALPAASETPEPVLVGTCWREALALRVGEELVGELRPRPGETLRFAAGLPSALVRPGAREPDLLWAVLEHDGRPLDERRVPLVAGPLGDRAWVDVRWGVERFAGRDLTVRFGVEPGEPGRAAACVLTPPEVWTPRAAAPVVLLVTSDTHRADHLGLLPDGATVDTPVLDALAARGVAFLDCGSPTNVTGPAHQALFTGLHPRDLRPVVNGAPLDGDLPTLAERFRERGWATLAVVSAKHLGPRHSGLMRGFQRFDRPEQAQRVGAVSVSRLAGWLDELPGRPVFAWLHLFDAHAPYDPPDAFDRRYYPRDADPFADDHGQPGPIAPRDMPGLRDMAFARAQYAAEVAALDHELAGLLARDAVVAGVTAFVGDHGEGLGLGPVHFDHAELYPQTLDVPLLLAWPGAPAGERTTTAVCSHDLGRTLLDLAGLRDEPFPGRSLWPSTEPSGPRFAVSAGGLSAAVRDGRWFLVLHLADHRTQHTVRAYARHEVELYDVRADRLCAHDRSTSEPDVARRLRARLVAWLEESAAAGSAAPTDAETADLLAELGYLGTSRDAGSAWWEPDDCARCRAFEAAPR